MATFDYSTLNTTAETLLARFGKSATLRQQSFSSGTAWAPTYANTDTTVTVVEYPTRIRDMNGTLTREIMRTLYVSTAAGVTPAKGDKVQVDSIWHEIDQVRTLNPGGTVLMHEVDLMT